MTAQELADAWNREHPAGTAVVCPVNEGRAFLNARTETPAEVDDEQAVVHLAGIDGPVVVSDLTVVMPVDAGPPDEPPTEPTALELLDELLAEVDREKRRAESMVGPRLPTRLSSVSYGGLVVMERELAAIRAAMGEE